MDVGEARAWLERALASDTPIALDADAIEVLLANAISDPERVAEAYYPTGAYITANDARYMAVWGGYAGAGTPTWGAGTTDDGTIRWLNVGTPEWDLPSAAATGWDWIASRVASNYDFGMEGGSWNRSQVFEHAQKMAAHYRSLSPSSDSAGHLGSIIIRTSHSYGLKDPAGDPRYR